MHVKQEQPVLRGQQLWNNHSSRGGEQQVDRCFQKFDNSDSFGADPATVRFHFQLNQQQQQQQDRRRHKTQLRRYLQLNQLTQQDIIAWAQGLSHPRRTPSCQPHHQQHPQRQQYPQVIHQSQPQLHQSKLIKMEDGKHYPYIVGSDADYWPVEYGHDFLPDMTSYGTPNDGIHQTTDGYHVSGRDLGPSHSHSNHNQPFTNKGVAGTNASQHMAWPNFQGTFSDKYSPPPFATIDTECPRQQAMPAIFGDPSTANFMGMHHGLASNGWGTEPVMHALGDPLLGHGQVNPPETTYSSFSSSAASDAMASMSLDTPMGHHGLDMTGTCPSTISPKVLRINPSPAPTTSSDTTHTTFFSAGDGDFSSASSFEQQYLHGIPYQPKRLNAKGRKELPEAPRFSRFASPASEASSSRRTSEKHVKSHRSKHLADLKPKPQPVADPLGSDDPGLFSQSAERSKQNEFLIQSKQAGMTYRDIKREGGFKEAESTLRGRYRTLTKPKVARVRKPEWTSKDIELLKTAVAKMTKGADSSTVKIPWKKVADYISKNGGSYQFGNATCCKRWEELKDHERMI